MFFLALAGCASDYNPSRPYSSDEVRQLALEDLARRSLSFEEYQASVRQFSRKTANRRQPVQRRPTQYRHLEASSNGQEKAAMRGFFSTRGWAVSRRTGA
ncbi:hypothetical protein P4114_26000 [Pseudomonas aeruginosa]|nr:hypothetical protein [Pseudomonas aeruginosa]